MLLFCVGNDRYAVLGRQVVEVVPLVELKKLAGAPPYVLGLLNYRGKIIPVVDLCQLLSGSPCHSLLSTRIIIVNYYKDEENSQLVGLIAERVTETLDIVESNFVDQTVTMSAAYLRNIITDEEGMIQWIEVNTLLSDLSRKYLLSQLDG